MVPSNPTETLWKAAGITWAIPMVAWLVASSGSALSLEMPCTKTRDRYSLDYQLRDQMKRCEGARSQEIAAPRLRLVSFTIGMPEVVPLQGGRFLRLRLPVLPGEGGTEVKVVVQARKRNYKMEPLDFQSLSNGWREFRWGSGVIEDLEIPRDKLLAKAVMEKEGAAVELLPVWFAPAKAYSLILEGNTTVELMRFQVRDGRGRIVQDFLRSGNKTNRGEVYYQFWEASRLPAGVYTIEASTIRGATSSVNVRVRHDPRWLTP